MGPYKIAHEMIRVIDPEKTIKFSEDAFGFHLNRIKEKPEAGFNIFSFRS